MLLPSDILTLMLVYLTEAIDVGTQYLTMPE